MFLLVETIKAENGKLLNLDFHNERMARSLYDLFGQKKKTDIEGMVIVPDSALKGVFKCRVMYNDKTADIEFVPYVLRNLRSLMIVHDDNISYSYKYTDRQNINRLYDKKGNCDEILIVKNGMVTDSSYANVVFRDTSGKWYTPSTCLLPGTRRACLLKNGLIEETEIPVSEISQYSEVKLINAMMGIDDTKGIPVSEIFLLSDLESEK